MIFRAILSDKVSLGEVARGDVTLDQIMRLNAWLDYKDAVEHEHAEQARKKQKR